MNRSEQLLGKIAYAFLFLLVVPVFLWYWAQSVDGIIDLPVFESELLAWTTFLTGTGLMLWGMLSIMRYGRGLPMNAFPPQKLVTLGSYRICRHPIYVGFGLLVVGFFLLIGSPGGLWLVSPVTVLSMLALVVGYENIDLRKRFPNKSHSTLIDFPSNDAYPADIRDRMISLVWVVSFLLLSNILIHLVSGQISPASGTWYMMESLHTLPLLQVPGVMAVLIVPLLVRSKKILRGWVSSCLLGLSISTFTALFWQGSGAYHLSGAAMELFFIPAYMVLISAHFLVIESKKSRYAYAILGLMIACLQLNYSRSIMIHGLAALAIYFLSVYYFGIWLRIKRWAETIANSWREWTIGKVRIINHGFYVGFGAFAGILFAGILAGTSYAWIILLFAIIVIVFSAIWAQVIEGSEKLKRPFGYYGALVGILIAGAAVWSAGYSVWLTIGVITVVMPWVQAIGRLRCLINGCCHGAKVDDPTFGIRYFHPRSRVCRISKLKGEWLHPTPLYSMGWLVIVGIVLFALWDKGSTAPFVFGIYLILTGLGRFVEEAYRGEVQTPIIRGLRLYQWTATASIFTGIGMTFIRVPRMDVTPAVGVETLLAAVVGGLFTVFVMGVDFPYSNARFSRLV